MSIQNEPDPTTGELDELPIRDRILGLLTAADQSPGGGRGQGLTAVELADTLQRHVTTIRHHLDRLIRRGLVTSHDQPVPVGRPRRCYTLARTTSVPTDFYRVLGEIFADAATPEVGPEEAGRRWALQHASNPAASCPPQPARTPGEWLAKLGPLTDYLQQWGYEPSVETGPGGFCAKLTLGGCPVRELVEQRPGPVCAAHRGMIRGTLEAVGEQTQVELTVAPHRCIALISALETPIPPPTQPTQE